VRTHPVDKLLEQHCYKSAAGLIQVAYVCNINMFAFFFKVFYIRKQNWMI
jgi:hypothetical protein